jgi:hypothetical protein
MWKYNPAMKEGFRLKKDSVENMGAKPRGEKSVPHIGDFHILSINLLSLLPILASCLDFVPCPELFEKES